MHLVTEDDLIKIYGDDSEGQIIVGRLAGAESIPVRIDLDRMVTRHSAILGSTGSGKSTAVASLMRTLASGTSTSSGHPNARILILDVHGEYANALASVATTFKVGRSEGERPLYIPYWAVDVMELLPFLCGRLEDKAFAGILDRITTAKEEIAKATAFQGVDAHSITSETPLPYSLKQLWYSLIEPEVKTWADQARTKPALVDQGDAETLTAPKYQPPGAGSSPPFINGTGVLSIRRQLDLLRSRLLDHRYDFMLHPGEWEPDLTGKAKKDLPDLLAEWLGHDKPITILDLSGVPSNGLLRLIAGILNIVYEALFWGRNLPEGGRSRPDLVVMEEAHRYLGTDSEGPVRAMVQRIVKEGRKFGIGAMIISQRTCGDR